ncbi:hypothetical protein [Nostoc sp. 'Lobaria pulmonaria (5183) cyanobiont']|uniref:hypothetical protein n=1 Tax=Nostoc sp. 'Lobaria pulmonaria (5183) cyanobiont' TaxID=1618022 RepID=UPI000CF35775|nr:hypothetical protein [Nostoc sp. 'Lobaria pulmonaria (5183) cyanobiont']AVH69968.1 hypothetical protein NLP_1158 [Nostoc sp. 'Lobaria pulmonaria (5183) cyanobiont']
MFRQKLAFKVLVPLVLVLGGCGRSADIEAAKSLSRVGQEADVVFEKIADDFYQSCLRAADYTPLKSSNTEGINQDRITAEKECYENPQVEQNSLDSVNHKPTPKDASQALTNGNQVIINYLIALGRLASDDLINYDPQLNSIEDSLKQIPEIKTDVVGAGTAIAQFLFRVFSEQERRSTLKDAVLANDQNLTSYIDGFSNAINKGYSKGALESEKLAVDNYYKSYLGRIININTANSSNLEGISVVFRDKTTLELDQEWKTTKSTLVEKQKIADLYVEILKEISQDHHTIKEMYQKDEKPSSTQIRKMVKTYVKKLDKLVEQSNKVFKDNVTSNEK